jgi:hypothetical protein
MNMPKQDIDRIVAACGYNVLFDERVSPQGDGTQCNYVKASTRGAKNRRTRSLGKLEAVEKMSQDDLVKLIESKMAHL